MSIGLERRVGVQRLLGCGFVFLAAGMLWGACGGEPVTDPNGDVGSGASCEGGHGGSAAGSRCISEADCPKPASAKCGKATCVDGVCGLDLVAQPGELKPLKSQRRGDCETVVCDGWGNLLTLTDATDFYDDGKLCTVDMCGAAGSMNLAMEDTSPCPGDGWCLGGDCVECIMSASGLSSNCGNGNSCRGNQCYPASCTDGVCVDGCFPCKGPYPCSKPTQCQSGICGPNGKCAAPTCNDIQKNGDETGTDCGGPSCDRPCTDGQGCAVAADCESGVCWAAICEAATCSDGVKNGSETDIDCGGSCAACL